ncbi:MAG: hypothetical protein AAGI38_16820 [Bacteroidota bacterium]
MKNLMDRNDILIKLRKEKLSIKKKIEELEIQIPRNQPQSPLPDLDELAETVEFEEIREK